MNSGLSCIRSSPDKEKELFATSERQRRLKLRKVGLHLVGVSASSSESANEALGLCPKISVEPIKSHATEGEMVDIIHRVTEKSRHLSQESTQRYRRSRVLPAGGQRERLVKSKIGSMRGWVPHSEREGNRRHGYGSEGARSERGPWHWHFKSGPAEWVGTDVIFDLSQDGEYTIVLFGHKNSA